MECVFVVVFVVVEIVENYMSNIWCILRSGKYSIKDNLEDVMFFV